MELFCDCWLKMCSELLGVLPTFKPLAAPAIFYSHWQLDILKAILCQKSKAVPSVARCPNICNMLRIFEYMLQSHVSSWGFSSIFLTILNLLLFNIKRSSTEQITK